MKLSRKLALSLVVGITAIMAGDAWVRVRREVALFEADQAADQEKEARLLAAVVREEWRLGGEEEARRLVDESQDTRGLGTWFVGRPMEVLCAKARRVGEGDFAGPLGLSQRDEVGQLAAEIDAMCERLVAAHRRVEAEAEAQIAALEQLRHADRLKTIGQLASGVAHEVGTPLNVVLGRASMIAAGNVGPSEVAGCARIIVEQAERVAGIIRQLLDFSRRRQPRIEASNVADIAARALEMVGPLAAERHVRAVLQAPAEVLAQADEGQMLQALTNLIVNGIQAMANGGRLTVYVDHVQAWPPAGHRGPTGEYVRVQVEDAGHGIAPDALPHVFEPFFTTKGVGEGTGLGLSVTNEIVRDHGGWIEVASTLGQGSRFSLFLHTAGA